MYDIKASNTVAGNGVWILDLGLVGGGGSGIGIVLQAAGAAPPDVPALTESPMFKKYIQ